MLHFRVYYHELPFNDVFRKQLTPLLASQWWIVEVATPSPRDGNKDEYPYKVAQWREPEILPPSCFQSRVCATQCGFLVHQDLPITIAHMFAGQLSLRAESEDYSGLWHFGNCNLTSESPKTSTRQHQTQDKVIGTETCKSCAQDSDNKLQVLCTGSTKKVLES